MLQQLLPSVWAHSMVRHVHAACPRRGGIRPPRRLEPGLMPFFTSRRAESRYVARVCRYCAGRFAGASRGCGPLTIYRILLDVRTEMAPLRRGCLRPCLLPCLRCMRAQKWHRCGGRLRWALAIRDHGARCVIVRICKYPFADFQFARIPGGINHPHVFAHFLYGMWLPPSLFNKLGCGFP